MIATAQPTRIFQARPMIITAKYASACRVCSKQVLPGDRVEWVKGDKQVSHVACTEAGKDLVLAVQASKASAPKKDAAPVPCPEGLTYLPYQEAGIQHLTSLPEGALVADEQGLGKTIQAIGLCNVSEDARKVLVVCPASVRINWQRECEKWLTERTVRRFSLDMQSGRVVTVERVEEPVVSQFPDVSGDVVVVNYDVLPKLAAALPCYGWDIVILDEVHYCKNPKAGRTKEVLEIKKYARRVIGLTGTPIPNKPIELFPILQLVAPQEWDPPGRAMRKVEGRKTYVEVGAGQGAGFFRFAKRYANAHEEWVSKTKKVWVFDGSSNLPELQEKLRETCMVRRLKSEVLKDLPPKRRSVVCFPVEGRGLVDEVTGECKGLSSVMRATTLDEVAKAMTKCKVEFTEYSAVRHSLAMRKVDSVQAHVVSALESGSEKVIVFAHHRDVVAELKSKLSDFGAVVLDGESTIEERQAAVDAFQTDEKVRVFIGTIGAAGVGLTLTAAQHVVFAELPLRPADLVQAEDRAHRIGQKGSVLVDILVWDGSVDAHIAKMLVAKQDVADMALDDDTGLLNDTSGRETVNGGLTYAEAKEKAFADAGLTKKECEELLSKMRYLASTCDGAQVLDGHGFSKFDAGIGHALAACRTLSPKQALVARKLAQKYRRQLEGRSFS